MTQEAEKLMSEAELQQSIVKAARDLGWLVYHTRNTLQSEPGFPDLVMVRPPRVIFAELKTPKGKYTGGRWNKARARWLPGQDDWARELQGCPGVEYLLVRPADIEAVYQTLMEGE